MNNPWDLSDAEARLLLAYTEHGCAKTVSKELQLAYRYVDNVMSRAVRTMQCRNRTQAAIKFDRWHQTKILMEELAPPRLERINMALALRLRQALRGEAA